jgi:hypothetical protein
MIVAVVVFGAGLVLAIAKPGDLGGKDNNRAASSTTIKPSSTGSTTGTTTATSAPGSTVGPQSSSSSSSASTPTTAKPATSTTVTPGGLGQSGAGGASGTHPITGGTSLLALGLVMMAAALALRRSAIA